MDLIKKYFDTPNVPLVFYYTPYVAVHIFMIIFMLNDGASVLKWLWTIVTFILGSYTYAWLSDYMLYTSQSVFVRYIFMKSVVFRRDFGQLVKSTHSANKRDKAFKIEGNKVREDKMLYVKRTFVSIAINVVVKFLLAMLLFPIFIISIFTHPIVIKKYREAVARNERNASQ